MNFYIANQNPDSIYNDMEGKHYEYPTGIPNGKQLKVGDYLLFNLNKKSTVKLSLGDRRLTGIAKIDDIQIFNTDKEMALASYEWYKEFTPPLTYEQIGGDVRSNIYNSINKIDQEKVSAILFKIIQHL